MTKKQLETKYKKMLERFEKGHSELKHLKQDMVKLRTVINGMPDITEERNDEINMKN